MKLIDIGFGNSVALDHIISIIAPDSAPVKRVIRESDERGTLINGTFGRKTASVIFMDSGHVVLSALTCEELGDKISKITEE